MSSLMWERRRKRWADYKAEQAAKAQAAAAAAAAPMTPERVAAALAYAREQALLDQDLPD